MFEIKSNVQPVSGSLSPQYSGSFDLLPTTSKEDVIKSQCLSNTCFKRFWNITDIPFINIKTVKDGLQYILLLK